MVRYDYQDLSEQLYDYQWLAFGRVRANQLWMPLQHKFTVI